MWVLIQADKGTKVLCIIAHCFLILRASVGHSLYQASTHSTLH